MESGQVIAGKYRLNQPIGAGGMASVWSAINTFTERHVAIKFMHSQVSCTPEAARRFLLEAKVSARVNHPNIIDILDVGQSEDGGFFMVMELLQGVSLETAIRRQSPPMLVHEFVGLMIDVARALAAAHKNSVVHRDLKPTNIFLHMIRESVAVPKVLDFGVSKFLEEDHDQALTIAGTVLGSPLYMSPEQASGSAGLDGRTDIFAFGAILFEGLCGSRAYDAPNFNALIVAIATRQPRSIHECAPLMPESLRQLVQDCLVTDRDKRIASFEDVVDRLIAVLPELEPSGLRLAVHESARVDPEATSAMPLMRQSDRPPSAAPPVGVHLSSPPTYSGGATSPGGLTGDRNAITVSRRPALLFGAGGAGAALLLVGLVIIAFRSNSSSNASAPTDTATPVSAAANKPTTPPRSALPTEGVPAVVSAPPRASDPPVIDIDSLPQVVHKPPPPPVQQSGMGRISVAATSGWCNVAIDGVSRGPTPIASMELSAGPHQLACTAANGKAKSMMVIVPEGATNKLKISLD